MYPSKKEALEMRVLDLKSRMEELDRYIAAHCEWMISGFEELRFSQDELATVDPQEFYTVRELQRAINLAEEELCMLKDEE